MNDILIEGKGLQKIYTKEKISIPVLRGVDFTMKRGESVAIIGSSGAGKSTLLQILGTLDDPSVGKVYFTGRDGIRRDVFAASEEDRSRFRNRHMGFVFQFHHLLPEFTALENVMMPGLIAGRSDHELRIEATRLLEMVGLKHRLNHKPGELSGGECQRAAVARAIFMKPEILFGDELTGNLDSTNGTHLIELLLDINKNMGLSLLVVTHDHGIAKRMSRTIELRDGQVVV